MCGGWMGDVFRIGTAVVAVAVAAYTGNPFAIAAAVGAVTSAVGYYTNSKELQIAGTVIGAVGAVGGLANAAGLFELADIGLSTVDFGLGSATAAGAGGLAADGGLPGSFNIAQEAASNVGPVTVATMPDPVGIAGGFSAPEVGLEAGGNPFNPLNNVAANAASPNVIPSAAVSEGVTPSVGGGMINQPVTAEGGSSAFLQTSGDSVTPATGAPSVTPADPSTITGAATPAATGANGLPSTESLLASGGAKTPGIGIDRLSGGNDVWDKMWKFLDSNSGGRITTGALMAGGAFLSGATSSLTPAQVDAYRAQAEANLAAANNSRQQTALSQQQLANMNGALPVATRTPKVTGSVEPQAPMGLINTPPRLAPVTGAPA